MYPFSNWLIIEDLISGKQNQLKTEGRILCLASTFRNNLVAVGVTSFENKMLVLHLGTHYSHRLELILYYGITRVANILMFVSLTLPK